MNMTITQDFTLIGAGIMSATLAVLIKELMPDAQVNIYERLDSIAAESSDAWNNAGTGHSAFCELNYTPMRNNGEVDISKALKISEQFEISKQLWAYLRKTNKVKTETSFINDIDHMSFVWGEDNINFLKKRYETMTPYAMFEDMKYSEDHSEVKDWIPLMMNGRDSKEEIGVTSMAIGTDVNFGAITRGMIRYVESLDGVDVKLGVHVNDIEKKDDNWRIEIQDLKTGEESEIDSKFVFIGAGGGALKLLEKSDIKEGRGYGGFPVSGQFLKCNNAGIQNIDLTKYLIEQVVQSPKDRFEFLKLYYPEARFEDWELITAGQRVQIIKKDEKSGGKLQFGTEIVCNEDHTLLALLGASPGASTAVSIMLKLLNICHSEKMSGDWKTKLKEIFPSYGQSLIKDGKLLKKVRDYTTEILRLEEV